VPVFHLIAQLGQLCDLVARENEILPIVTGLNLVCLIAELFAGSGTGGGKEIVGRDRLVTLLALYGTVAGIEDGLTDLALGEAEPARD
jgi:hypothetical protein